jgi:lysyl-tRNA synthetase class II
MEITICLLDHFKFKRAFSNLNVSLLQRSRFENQIKQHNAKRAAMAKEVKSTEGEGDDDYSYEVSLDEDFLTSLEYGMPPASGMVGLIKLCIFATANTLLFLELQIICREPISSVTDFFE